MLQMIEESSRPNFTHPPVIETVVGVQFEPIAGFNLAHFGLFWSRIRAEYDRVEFKEPATPLPQFGAVPPFLPIRAWFTDASDSHLVQLQNDRLVYNWRKITTAERPPAEYPHYHAMRPRFEHLWRQLIAFLGDEGLGAPAPTICEVAYINHIAIDDVLGISRRMNESFPILPPDPPSVAKGAGFLDFSESLIIEPDQMQLRISLSSAINIREQKPVFQLQIATISSPDSRADADLFRKLDANQQLAARVFVECTSPQLHQKWGRIDNQ